MSGVIKNVNFGLIVQKIVRCGYGAVVLMKVFGTPSISDTSFSQGWCGEGGLQVNLVITVGYHSKPFKEVINIGVYLEVRHESVHVVVGGFLGADICTPLDNLGLIRALVGKVAELLAFAALDLDNVPRLPLDIVGMCFAAG